MNQDRSRDFQIPNTEEAGWPSQEVGILLYESAVRQLLSGQMESTAQWESFHQNTGVTFSGEDFLLAELEDDPNHPSCPPADVENSTPGQRFCVLRARVLDVVGSRHPTVLCNQGGRLLCVVNWQGGETNWQKHFIELIDELNRAFQEEFHFCFQCTVSRLCTGVKQLPEANRELDQARNYRKLLGGLPGEFVFYDGILHTTGLENRESSEKQEERKRQLFLALLQGDAGAAKSVFHSVMEDYFTNSRPAVQFAQLRFFEVIDLFMKALDKVTEELGRQEVLREIQAGPRLLAAEDVTELERTADDIMDEFTSLIGKNGVQARLPNRIRSYIQEQYQDPNLNVNKVADEFHVTPTYATRVFKQEFQCGILSYIQKVRVEEAKKLLDSTHTIKEVSEKVGFATPSALIRSFKKLEGTTPTRFLDQESGEDTAVKGA